LNTATRVLNPADRMKQYKVTLNFTFEPEYYDLQGEDEDLEEHLSNGETAEEMRKAFRRTEDYYEKYGGVEKHVKQNDALSFVETLCCDCEIVSAEWDRKTFAIHIVLDTDQTEEELENDFRMTSLEDGEYEACGDTGWIVFTRGPNDEIFSGWSSKGFWAYGLTDYRQNPITISLLGEKTEIPNEDELISMTEKGKEVYQKMAALKKEGIRFSEEDERKFAVMKILMGDTRHYPVGKA
jgi:hypothetical protein